MLAQVFFDASAAQDARHLAVGMDEAARAFPAIGGAVHIDDGCDDASPALR
ncbi:hypothetical protein D3C76_1842030 [compost metagenome]